MIPFYSRRLRRFYILVIAVIILVLLGKLGDEFPIASVFSGAPTDITELISSITKNLDTDRFDLQHHTFTLTKSSYLELKSKFHHHDPRISFAAAMYHLNHQNGEMILPFSWQDWVDLSALNPFLKYEENEKPNCATFLNVGLRYSPDDLDSTSDLNSNSYDEFYCSDNQYFLETENGKYHVPQLLPGFNFNHWMKEKKSFPEKLIFAKSNLLSNMETPSNLFFLTNNGTFFKVKPVKSQSMLRNDLLGNFLNSLGGTDQVTISTFEEFDKLVANVPLEESTRYLEMQSKISEDKNYSLDKSAFIMNTNKVLNSIQEDEETEFTDKFVESIQFSSNVIANSTPKYFHEVNINFPGTYNSVALKENGGHYDFRFFSGFLTTMPKSVHTPHSPNFQIDSISYSKSKVVNADNSTDSGNKRKEIILSHLIHTLLTVAFHSGHHLFPAHGSLLAWYFNGLTFPWDTDGDVQFPINDLFSFCNQFNQSMIFQNPKFGMGKYFVDCSSFLTHREKSNGENNIDARFIDIDSGLFVDITGLAVSSEALTQTDMTKFPDPAIHKLYPKPISTKKGISRKRQQLIFDHDEIFEFHEKNGIINCRNRHFYSAKQFESLSIFNFENAPAFFPSNFDEIKQIISAEYGDKSLLNLGFDEFLFSRKLKMWVPAMDIFKSCLKFAKIKDPDVNPRSIVGMRGNSNFKPKTMKGARVFKCFSDNEDQILVDLLQNDDIVRQFKSTISQSSIHSDQMLGDWQLKDKTFSVDSVNGVGRKAMLDYLFEIEG
ncbi:hypothetical protein DAMA08_023160 [Martiniozyma asiatica (nom. inval.)]|nr:hypothetical protein DAMA08_023160 [Martiniozyma asiatica]